MSTSNEQYGQETDLNRDDVAFSSSGKRCEGSLYIPRSSGPHPCVVMAHGIGGIRSAALPNFATRFAAAGFAALTFDYRHLGTSEGVPRGLIDIRGQRADLRAAIDFARAFQGIDDKQIFLVFTSFGSGHVLAGAARDPFLAGAIIQNPFVDSLAAAAAAIRSGGRVHAYRMAWRAARDRLHERCGRGPVQVELAGERGSLALMTTPDVVAGLQAILPADPEGSEPEIPARIVLQMRLDRPAQAANLVACPLLVCVCEHDVIAPPGRRSRRPNGRRGASCVATPSDTSTCSTHRGSTASSAIKSGFWTAH